LILPEQIRAGRALLGINQDELATLSRVGVATVKRIETQTGRIRGAAETIWKIQNALEAQGVEFIAGDVQKGPGVRLAAPRKFDLP
jgi:transcriptional regulator with XRE-family HTH domain